MADLGQHGDMVTPLLVMMALVAYNRDGALPEGRSALYRDYVSMLFSEGVERRGHTMPAPNLWSAAKCLAEKSANEFGALEPPAASECLRTHIPQTVFLRDDALKFLVEDIGLLETFGKRVRFSHSSFFEYFLALHVAESLHSGKLKRRWLAQQWRNRKYSEVIVFAVQIASFEGFAVADILTEIAQVTAFAAKCHRVAALNLSELLDEDLLLDNWEESDEIDGDKATQNAEELLADAGEALAYVVRCGAAIGNRAPSDQLGQVAQALVDAILNWFRADYQDNTTLRSGELAIREGIHETLVRVCRMAPTPRVSLRVSSQETSAFGRGTCLRLAAALAEATGLQEDVRLLAQCVESGDGFDEWRGLGNEDVDEYELQCEETALSTLYELDKGAQAFRQTVLSRLEYWQRLTDQSDRYEKFVRLAIGSDPVQIPRDLGPRLLDFATMTEKRTQLLFRSAPEWVASLIVEALGRRPAFSFDEVDTMALLWGVESQRATLVSVLNDFLRELGVDSNAMNYLLACVPGLRFYDQEAVVQMASHPVEIDEFPNGRFVYDP
jgi:hypothetical protein